MAGDTVYTTAAAGNTSVGANWVGGSVPPSGSRVVIAHAMVLDADTTWGDSPPARVLTTPTVSVTGGGSSGGSLAAGTYRVTYAPVDSGGKVGAPSPASATFTVSAGNIPRVTLPSRPTGVASWDIYLTNTNAPTGARKLYASGITATTVDLSLGTWLDDSLASSTYASADAEAQGFAMLINNSVSLEIRARLTLKGDSCQGNSTTTINRAYSGTGVRFDASGSVSPANNSYKWYMGRAYTQSSCKIATTGTGNAVLFDSVTTSSAAKGCFIDNVGDGGVGSYTDTAWWDIEDVDFVDVGDDTNSAARLNPSTTATTNRFINCRFSSGCGALEWRTAPPAGGGWDIQDCEFNQTNAKLLGSGARSGLYLRSGTGTITGTRKLYRCTFATGPTLTGRSLDIQDCYFAEGWPGVAQAEMWAGMTGCLIRFPYDSINANGSVTGCFILFDSGSTATSSGTSSGGNTSTTLNDSGKGWTVNAYQAGLYEHWFVEITGGTGVGQRRGIKSNTATILTVTYRWDTTPDATSTYEIKADIRNNHGIAADNAITTGTLRLAGNVAQSAGTDTQGDVFLHLDRTGVNYELDNNVIAPNAQKDSSGTLLTAFTAATNIKIRHNTAFTGAQAALSLSEGGVGAAGQVDEVYSNIFWCYPDKTPAAPNNTSDLTKYYANGGAYGPYAAVDTNNATNPAAGTTDLIVAGAANYNVQYGSIAGVNGNGWQVKYTTTPDANGWWNTDPDFVDPDRSFWSWAVSRGSSSATITGQIADGIAYIKADPTLTRTSLIPYMQAGVAPRNIALKDAGHDSITVGAVEGVFSSGGRLVGPGLVGPGPLVSRGYLGGL